MKGNIRRMASLVAPLLLVACADGGQERVDIPLFVAGSDVSAPVMAVGEVPVTILRADLAFGPLYLCAGKTAGDLCETARLEWLDTAVVNTTSERAVSVGELSGVTGPVRSWMYDLGISSQLTRSDPYVLEAAQALDGASFVVEGMATLQGVQVPFSASIPIRQGDTTELGVPVIRKGTKEPFFREVTGDESGLTLKFDPALWLSRLDFGSLVENETCSPGGPSIVCEQHVESICDEDGTQVSTRDCREQGEVCLSGKGCRDQLILDPKSEAYRSLAIALTTTGRPSFQWDD